MKARVDFSADRKISGIIGNSLTICIQTPNLSLKPNLEISDRVFKAKM